MIETVGPYILVLVMDKYGGGGLATHEMESFEACKSAVVQLEPILHVTGYCIAKNLKEPTDE